MCRRLPGETEGMSGCKNSLPVLDGIISEHRALATLRMLERAARYCSNEGIVAAWLEQLGMPSSREQIRHMFDDFESRGFVRCERPAAVLVVTLTQLGHEVALGLQDATGVLRPRPEEPY